MAGETTTSSSGKNQTFLKGEVGQGVFHQIVHHRHHTLAIGVLAGVVLPVDEIHPLFVLVVDFGDAGVQVGRPREISLLFPCT